MCVFINFFLEKHFQQMIDDGIVVEAEIYSCRQRHLRAPYASVYKYVDENGRKYIGRLKPIYKTKEEAETQDRKSTRQNSSHYESSRMPSSA